MQRETIELAFLAVIQLLPPRQRAVLILREVLGWSARDGAALLEIGVAAVNSALQRARATLREQLPPARREEWTAREASATERELLAGFIDTHERGDVDGALALIADDMRVTMPPQPVVYEGRAAIRGLMEIAFGAESMGDVAAGPDAREPACRPPRATCAGTATTRSARSSSTCCASRAAGSPSSRRSTRRCSRPSAFRRRSDARYLPRMGRIGRGWQMSKQSWAIVKADRSLLVFPFVAGVCALIVAVVFGGAAYGVYDVSDSEPLAIVIGVIGLYVLMTISIFCNVALTACAARSLDGEDTTPGQGWTAARARFGPILSWAGVSLVVGAAISALQALLREGAGPLVSSIVGSLANFAWTVASFFVIPLIAFEGLGPWEALKRSVSIIKQRWGEGVTGSFAIGALVFLFAFLPGAILVAIGIAVGGAVAAVLIIVGVAIFAVGAAVQTALMAVFKVALYRFAVEDRVVGQFDRAQLESAFRPRGRRARAAGI